jgi:hypothetical protein
MNSLTINYRYPFGCLIAGAIAFFIFLLLGIKVDSMWFARGGSIVVLLGAAAEYGLLQVQQEVLNNRVAGLGTWGGPMISNLDIPPPFPRLRIAAHVFVVVGTFVWGFGDILLK